MSSLQKQYYFCNIFLIVTIVFIAGCARRSVERPVTRPTERPTTTHPPASQQRRLPADIPRLATPTIRVGLKTDAKLITISSEGPVQFSDGSRSKSESSP